MTTDTSERGLGEPHLRGDDWCSRQPAADNPHGSQSGLVQLRRWLDVAETPQDYDREYLRGPSAALLLPQRATQPVASADSLDLGRRTPRPGEGSWPASRER